MNFTSNNASNFRLACISLFLKMMKLSELARREVASSINTNLIAKLKPNGDGAFNDFRHFNSCCAKFARGCGKAIKFLKSSDIALLPDLEDNLREHKEILLQAAGILLFYRTLDNFDCENAFDVEVMTMDTQWKLRESVTGL